MTKEANEELDRASRVAGSMQRSATGATCDADGFDATSERMQQLRMRRRTDIDIMFELPDVSLRDENIDWVSVRLRVADRAWKWTVTESN